MRQNKAKDILNYFIKNAPRPISCKELAGVFGVSERQIKNYIAQINKETPPHSLIKQTLLREYRLCDDYKNYLHLFNYTEQTPEVRVNTIIAKLLLARNAIDLFDLADEMYISRATLDADLVRVRQFIEAFDLILQTNRNEITLLGSEKNKRKLTSHMISNEQYADFMGSDKLSYLDNSYQVDRLKQGLVEIFDECHFIYNDYSLNNIVLHLVITIDRLQKNCTIEKSTPSTNISDNEREVTERVANFLSENYGITFSDIELTNLSIFLSCNLSTVDYTLISPCGLQECMDPNTGTLVSKILQKLREYYYLDNFDQVFVTRFTLHIDNLIKRIKSGFTFRNPLAAEIKHSYPLIYDIAVFVADMIREATGSMICPDEIAFIALHIGTLLESQQYGQKKITALYIYSDYHHLYKYNIEKIQKRCNDLINIKYSISTHDYQSTHPDAELLISESVGVAVNAIIVSPLITENELRKITDAANTVKNAAGKSQFERNLLYLFRENIFFNNLHCKDEFEVIHKIVQRLRDEGYVASEFEEDVVHREKISSTCFHNGLSMPHSISNNVTHSFISIASFPKGQMWGKETVYLTILIGIAYNDRKIFRAVFDTLIEIFADPSMAKEISQCSSYDDIVKKITRLIEHSETEN